MIEIILLTINIFTILYLIYFQIKKNEIYKNIQNQIFDLTENFTEHLKSENEKIMILNNNQFENQMTIYKNISKEISKEISIIKNDLINIQKQQEKLNCENIELLNYHHELEDKLSVKNKIIERKNKQIKRLKDDI